MRLWNVERLGLQRRIMLYVTAGLIVFSVIFGFVALQAIQQSTDLVYRERLLVARTVAREIDENLKHLQGELEDASIAVSPVLAANDLVEEQNLLRTLHNHWTFLHHFGNPCIISLTDARGRVVWSEPYLGDLVGRDLAQLPYLRDAFQLQRTVIGNGITPDASARPTIALAVPIRAGIEVLGFLVSEIDRPQIGQTLQPSLDVGETGYAIELIDDSGLVIATNEKGKQFSTSPHLRLIASFWAEKQAGVRTHTFQFEGRDRSHVTAFAPLSRIRWGIVVEQAVDEALVLPRNLQLQFALFGLLALAGGLLLAWATTRTVVRPVNALIHASQEIARGDLDHPLDRGGADEVGALARSFDEMRVRLRQSRAEIAGWNRELEARVEERTRELAASVEQIQQRQRELAALVESSHALTSTLDLDALLDILMKQTGEILPAAQGIALFLFEPETQRLVVRASSGFEALECARWRFRRGEAMAGKVFEAQTPVLLRTAVEVQSAHVDFSEENRAHFLRAVGNRRVQSALGVPLVAKGTRLGALMLYNFSGAAAFAEHDVPVLQALANQAAATIENARLYQEASEVGTLRELNRLKSEFVARASHELRTPVTAIKSLAESLLRRDLRLDAETQREFLEGIDSASDRLGGIVEELLTLSRIEAGQLRIRCEPIEIGALLARVVAQIRAQTPNRILDVQVAENLPPALGDAERVADVLTNLISNALKYSGADARVEIHAHAHPSAGAQEKVLMVSIRDHGIGIPPPEREKIFERFYRVDNALTRRVGGAGLGLYICQTYVQAMGGTIRVESHEGRGSVFSFTLPAVIA